jgi:hypothetical protein
VRLNHNIQKHFPPLLWRGAGGEAKNAPLQDGEGFGERLNHNIQKHFPPLLWRGAGGEAKNAPLQDGEGFGERFIADILENNAIILENTPIIF